MDSEKIDELINKYWNCETTLEEEKQLQEYFLGGQVNDSLKETAALFRYFEERRNQKLSDVSFDTEVLRRIRKPKSQMASIVYNTMRIAAGIVVLILALWLVRLEVRETAPADIADTYNDPDKAFEETKKALMMISRSFSTAEEHAKKLNLFNEAQQDLRKDKPDAEL